MNGRSLRSGKEFGTYALQLEGLGLENLLLHAHNTAFSGVVIESAEFAVTGEGLGGAMQGQVEVESRISSSDRTEGFETSQSKPDLQSPANEICATPPLPRLPTNHNESHSRANAGLKDPPVAPRDLQRQGKSTESSPAFGPRTEVMAKKAEAAAKRRAGKKRKRRRNEDSDSDGEGTQRRRLKFVVVAEPVREEADGFQTTHTFCSKGGYAGARDEGKDFAFLSGNIPRRLEFLTFLGYRIVERNFSIDLPILDEKGRVFCVILKRPTGWEERSRKVRDAISRLVARLGDDTGPNRRGNFGAYTTGYSFGMGRPLPQSHSHATYVQNALDEFFQNPTVQSVFRYAEGALGTWFPEHRKVLRELMHDIQTHLPHLQPPVDGTSFPASTVNVGPQTVCWPHRDGEDLSWGISLDYAEGGYDGEKGGHLVLHEARRILPLHPGDTALFPSSCITHENIPVDGGASRYSITGHFGTGLARFRDAGFRTYKAWQSADPSGFSEHEAKGVQRWQEGYARFLTLDELKKRWKQGN